eukprot:TRINITY_DN27704_c0_g1_i1.p1 TRINITY_DN27704_c0_g1~~TRINITY_DN27704_c0_g1_i1.p1  ORF type:complete len:262 (+),score=92.31 TRINITY_DN27704_c0_g1_i1:72-857(+)
MEGPSQDWERESAFFGYHPLEFIDDVINATHQICEDGFDDLETLLVAHAEKTGADPSVVKKGVDDLFEIVQHRVDLNFDRFELYVLKNIFRLPPSADSGAAVFAAPHAGRSSPSRPPLASPRKRPKQDSSLSSADITEDELDRQIGYLTAKIKEEQEAHEATAKRSSKLAKEVKVLEAYYEKMSRLMTICHENNVAKLGDVVDTVVNKHMAELERVISRIKEYVASHDLEQAFADVPETPKDAAAESSISPELLASLEAIL